MADKIPEMVERVARALATAAGGKIAAPSKSVAVREFGWDNDGKYMRDYVDRHWPEHVHAATLAIEAMRKPTESMKAEGESAASWGIGKPNDGQAIVKVWQAMVDRALAR